MAEKGVEEQVLAMERLQNYTSKFEIMLEKLYNTLFPFFTPGGQL